MRKRKKRPYFETAFSVVALFDKNPTWTSAQLGMKLGLHSAYVRKALARNGRKLANARAA